MSERGHLPSRLPWRTGRKVFRTLYDADDNLIGLVDRAEDASFIVGLADLFEQLTGQNHQLRAENAELRRQLGLS